jgi:hypothetical protein
MSDTSEQWDVLRNVVKRMPVHLQIYALDMARAFEDEDIRSVALSTIAPYLSGDLMPQIVSEAQQMKIEYFRCKYLASIASSLDEKRLIDAIVVAIEMKVRDHRHTALQALAHQMVLRAPAESSLITFLDSVDLLARRERCDVLKDIAALQPMIVTLNDERTIHGIFESINDVTTWWP